MNEIHCTRKLVGKYNQIGPSVSYDFTNNKLNILTRSDKTFLEDEVQEFFFDFDLKSKEKIDFFLTPVDEDSLTISQNYRPHTFKHVLRFTDFPDKIYIKSKKNVDIRINHPILYVFTIKNNTKMLIEPLLDIM